VPDAESWPRSSEVNALVAERVHAALDEAGGIVAEVGRSVLCQPAQVLAPDAHSLTSVLVCGTCLSAGGAWQDAGWPAAGAELMMAAADVFDDVADADPGSPDASGGVLLTAAAGLLALAGSAVSRVASPDIGVALGELLAAGFVQAANGQAANIGTPAADALAAYRQAESKSGPLGSLIARLGARTASDDPELQDLYGRLGWSLAVSSQLRNDARDVTSATKADVRAGASTVPLRFTGSRGAPLDLSAEALTEWEVAERQRIAAGGGIAAALALAEAARQRALQTLDELAARGRPVGGLRALLN
jgi:geranylgeranyl pyrophosphate synthase